jgi:hypothetical protein
MGESQDPVGAVLMRVVTWSNEAVQSYYDAMYATYVDDDMGYMDPDATFASLSEWARRLPDMDPAKQQLAINLLFVLGNAAFHAWLVGSSATDPSEDLDHDLDAMDGKNRARLHEFINGMTTLISPVIKSADGKRSVNELRAKIVAQLRSQVASAPPGARRVRMYTSLSIWDAIDQAAAVDSSQADACRTSLEAMSNCRASTLATLRALRARVEQVLSFELVEGGEAGGRLEKVSLHESREHLFASGTYKAMRGDIKAFIALTPDRKRERARLLLKLFEARALNEVWNRCIEMTEAADVITAALKKPVLGKTSKGVPMNGAEVDTVSRVVRLEVIQALENLEWACSRTWQQTFEHDVESDRMQWLHTPHANSAKPQAGGAGGLFDDPSPGTSPTGGAAVAPAATSVVTNDLADEKKQAFASAKLALTAAVQAAAAAKTNLATLKVTEAKQKTQKDLDDAVDQGVRRVAEADADLVRNQAVLDAQRNKVADAGVAKSAAERSRVGAPAEQLSAIEAAIVAARRSEDIEKQAQAIYVNVVSQSEAFKKQAEAAKRLTEEMRTRYRESTATTPPPTVAVTAAEVTAAEKMVTDTGGQLDTHKQAYDDASTEYMNELEAKVDRLAKSGAVQLAAKVTTEILQHLKELKSAVVSPPQQSQPQPLQQSASPGSPGATQAATGSPQAKQASAATEIDGGKRDGVRFPEEATRLAVVDDLLPEEPQVRAAVTAAQRAVIDARVAVRKVYAELRKAIADASTTSIPQGNMNGIFVADCVQPRLQAVAAAVGAAIRGYLASRYEPDGGETAMLLRREEKSRSSEIYSSRVPSIALLQLRLSDNGARLMVTLKGIRFLGQLAALWAAQRAYVEAYQSAVLAVPTKEKTTASITNALRPSEPPELTLVLCVFLGIDAMVQLVVLLILVIFAQLFVSPSSGAFVIDDDFLADFLADYFITTVAIGVLGLLVARLFKRKRYFDLANQGLVTAKAYCVVLAGTSAVAGLLMPAFLL